MTNRAHQQRIYYVIVRREGHIVRACRQNFRTAQHAETYLTAHPDWYHGCWVQPYRNGRPVSESNLPQESTP